MRAGYRPSKFKKQDGFTLLELIVAMVILTITMSIAFQAFSGTIRGWRRGTEVADGIKHGDFAMNQLSSALNSTIYFFNPKKSYAFTFEKNNFWQIFAALIRASENYKFSYDWGNLRRGLQSACKNIK